MIHGDELSRARASRRCCNIFPHDTHVGLYYSEGFVVIKTAGAQIVSLAVLSLIITFFE